MDETRRHTSITRHKTNGTLSLLSRGLGKPPHSSLNDHRETRTGGGIDGEILITEKEDEEMFYAVLLTNNRSYWRTVLGYKPV